jgi:hypothetical protein
LCRRAKDYKALTEISREQADYVSFVAALIASDSTMPARVT